MDPSGCPVLLHLAFLDFGDCDVDCSCGEHFEYIRLSTLHVRQGSVFSCPFNGICINGSRQLGVVTACILSGEALITFIYTLNELSAFHNDALAAVCMARSISFILC